MAASVTIYNPDGTVYWTQSFADQASATAWLADYKTRSFWLPYWTTTAPSVNNPPQQQPQQAASPVSTSLSILSASPASGVIGAVPATVIVAFNQAMGPSATNLANWSIAVTKGTISVTNATLSADSLSVTLTITSSGVYSGSTITLTGANLVSASGVALGGSGTITYAYYNGAMGTLTGLPLRPLATTSSWNQLLPDNPTVASYSLTQITNLLNTITHGINGLSGSTYIDCSLGTIGPIYINSPSDPTVTIHQTGNYGMTFGSPVPMPTSAQAASGIDAHCTILNTTTGGEVDFYQFNTGGTTIAQGATITSNVAGTCNYLTGSGWEGGINGQPGSLTIGYGGIVTSAGNTLMAGVVTIDELMSGQINHALSIGTWGNDTTPGVWPATAAAVYPNAANASKDANGNILPMPGPGSLIWSDLTDAQVDASGFDNFSKIILKAMHHYGAFCTDTEGYVAFNFRQIMVVPALNTSAQTAANNWMVANCVGQTTNINNLMFSLQQQPKSWFEAHWHLVDPTWLQTQRGGQR